MFCKLCLHEKRLLKKSHIIPDFMYRELFNEKHRLIWFRSDSLKAARDVPSGEYEPNILCESCDNKVIGSLEDYAKKVLFSRLLMRRCRVLNSLMV